MFRIKAKGIVNPSYFRAGLIYFWLINESEKMHEADIPPEATDRPVETHILAGEVEIYTGDGVLAETPNPGFTDIPDELPADADIEPIDPETPADTTDYQRFHEAVIESLEANPDMRTVSNPGAIEINEWPSREDDLPPGAKDLLGKVEVVEDAETISYKVQHQSQGEPDHTATVKYLRLEAADDMRREITLSYAISRSWPEYVADGSMPPYTGMRFAVARTWRRSADGNMRLVLAEPRDTPTTFDPELSATLEVNRAELQEVINHVHTTLQRQDTD